MTTDNDPAETALVRIAEDDERLPVVSGFIDDVLVMLSDRSLPLKERAGWYAVLRPFRLRIDRALRPVTEEITKTMVEMGARQWGPLKIVQRSQDVKYVCNDLGNWVDDGVQMQLGEWWANPDYRDFIRRVPEHFEVDTIALRDGLQMSHSGAHRLYQLLNDKGYRTTEGKKATLTVDGG